MFSGKWQSPTKTTFFRLPPSIILAPRPYVRAFAPGGEDGDGRQGDQNESDAEGQEALAADLREKPGPAGEAERQDGHVLGLVAVQAVRGARVDRGEGAEDLAEQVVDVDRVGRQAAAELAREGAAPAGGGVVGGRAPPVGLGGGGRRRRAEALGAEVVEFLDAVF